MCTHVRPPRERHGNGYCYLALFSDVLGARFDAKTTKRIFGAYPRVRYVLSQLYKFADSDRYVHDIYPTGTNVLHVSRHNLVRLSDLVVRYMFSDMLIGALCRPTQVSLKDQLDYALDARSDALLVRARQTRALGELVKLSQRDINSVYQDLGAITLNRDKHDDSSLLRSLVVERVIDNKMKTKRVNAPYSLPLVESTSLQAEYPEFDIIQGSTTSHHHALAATIRILTMELMLKMLDYSPNMSSLYGEDVPLIDMGGDYLCHLKQNRLNVHSCTPVVDWRDSSRETTREIAIAKMVKNGKLSKNMYHAYRGDVPSKQRCLSLTQDCHTTATYGILLHVQYEMTMEDLGRAMDNHKFRVVLSAVHFDPRVFTMDDFVIDAYKCRVTKSGKRINFDFVGDSSMSYAHDYANYIRLVTSQHLLTPQGKFYLIERVSLRSGVLILKFNLCDKAPMTTELTARFCYWFDTDGEMVVTTWKYQHGCYRDAMFFECGDDSTRGRFLRLNITLSRSLWNLIYSNCLRSSEKAYNLTEILSAAVAYNGRVTINGVDIRNSGERLETSDLLHVVVAAYCLSYCDRYGAGKVVETFAAQEKGNRSSGFSFLALISFVATAFRPAVNPVKLAWNKFIEYVSDSKAKRDMTFQLATSVRAVTLEDHLKVVAGHDHFAGEATILEDDGNVIDLLGLDTVELAYDNGRVRVVPVENENLRVPEQTPTPVSKPTDRVPTPVPIVTPKPTKAAPSPAANMTFAKSSTRSVKSDTNSVVRFMKRVGPDEHLDAETKVLLKKMRSEQVNDCDDLRVKPMKGDGNCGFYAMTDALHLPDADVCMLKRVLFHFGEAKENHLMIESPTPADWCTTDDWRAFSLMIKSALCMHIEMNCGIKRTSRMYSVIDPADAETTVHLRWVEAGHVDAFESTERDVSLRRESFVACLQDQIFRMRNASVKFRYDRYSRLPQSPVLNRSGLKLIDMLLQYPELRDSKVVIDLCGAPGGFLQVMQQVGDYDITSVSLGGDKTIRYQIPGGTVADIFTDMTDVLPAAADLVLADGGDERSYIDATLLRRQMELILNHTKLRGNALLKIPNVFTQMCHVKELLLHFERCIIVKPRFSLSGNSEVYVVMLGRGGKTDRFEALGAVLENCLRGLMHYYLCHFDGVDYTDGLSVSEEVLTMLGEVGFGVGNAGADMELVPLVNVSEMVPEFEETSFTDVLVPLQLVMDNTSPEGEVVEMKNLQPDAESDLSLVVDSGLSVTTLSTLDEDVARDILGSDYSLHLPQSEPLVEELTEHEIQRDVEDLRRERCERFADESVLAVRPERKESLITRLFGKKRRLCEKKDAKSKTRYAVKCEREITSLGVVPSSGKVIKTKATYETEHVSKREWDSQTHLTTCDIGCGPEGVQVGARGMRERKKVAVATVGTNTAIIPDPITKPEKKRRQEAPEVKDVPARTEKPVVYPVSVLLEDIKETKLNLPSSEPARMVVSEYTDISCDVYFTYGYSCSTKEIRVGPMGRKWFGKKKLTMADLAGSRPLLLTPDVQILYLNVEGRKIVFLYVDGTRLLMDNLIAVISQLDEVSDMSVRIGLDCLDCKYYTTRSYDLARVKLHNMRLVLFTKSAYPDKHFQSPISEHGGKPGVFPQLTDTDMRLKRCPGLVPGSGREVAFKNSMIEYIHSTAMSDKVLGLELRDEMKGLIVNGNPVMSRCAVAAQKRSMFVYDNEMKRYVTDCSMKPSAWGFVLKDDVPTFVEFLAEEKRYDTDQTYVLVNRKLKVMLNQQVVKNLKDIDIHHVEMPEIKWVNGPPGCGKTEFAIRSHKLPKRNPDNTVDRGDLILVATTEGKISLQERMKSRVDDEFLKENYRTIASVLVNGLREVSDEHGDSETVPFERVIVDEALMVHAGALAYVSVLTGCREMILIGDICQIPFIDRDRVVDMKFDSIEKYASISQTLVRSHRCPVDVACVLSKFYPGFYTVNPVCVSMSRQRYSGTVIPKLDDATYLVLFQSDKDDLIRNGYGKVLTVHEAQGQTFENVIYIRTKSKPLKLYESQGHAIVAISRHTKSFIYYSDEPDMVTKWIGDALRLGEGELKRMNASNMAADVTQMTGGYVCPPEKIFRPMNVWVRGDEAVTGLKYVEKVTHPVSEFVSTTSMRPIYSLTPQVVPVFRDTDLVYVQDWYNSAIETNAFYDVKRDQQIVEDSDLTLAFTDTLKIDPLRIGFKTSKFDKLQPRLNTIMPSNRIQSQRETILAMSKRNANAPMLMNDLSPSVVSEWMYKIFLKSCISEDGLDMLHEFDEIRPNPYLLQRWLDKQPPKIAKGIQSDVPYEERRYGVYNFMVKDKLKPPLEANAVHKYAGGQTIAYHDKDVNAVVCPIFMAARDRLFSILADNVMIMSGMSNEEFEAAVNAKYDIGDLWCANKVENDFSKYDKSQHRTLLLFEEKVYRMLGVPEDILEIWVNCHAKSRLSDRQGGVSMEVEYQRKSGDATTFFGNTLVLLGAMCSVYDFKRMRLGMFAGDDSLLFMDANAELKDATQSLAELFNLEAKLLDHYEYPYFCSKFLLNIGGVLCIVPDLLKVVTKLGRSDLVNYEHVEEYRISMMDNLKPYMNALVHDALSEALCERYKIYMDSSKVLRVLISYISDSNLFRSLYLCNDPSKLCKDPNRPKLD